MFVLLGGEKGTYCSQITQNRSEKKRGEPPTLAFQKNGITKKKQLISRAGKGGNYAKRMGREAARRERARRGRKRNLYFVWAFKLPKN